MSSLHINAKKGDFSDIVLMSGDPLRAKYIASNFLSNIKEVNKARGMLGYTGNYRGKSVSVMGHGIGIPSCSIYVKELITEFGVKCIIRLGSCGAVQKRINIRDVIIAMGASTNSKINRIRFKDYDFAALADFSLLCNVVDTAKTLGINFHVGNIFSSDLFYIPDSHMLNTLERYGILGIEMEAAGIYSVAAEFGAQAVALCTVSDHTYKKISLSIEERQNTLNEMTKIALESILLINN